MRNLILFVVLALGAPASHAQVLFVKADSTRPTRTYDVLHYKLVVGFDEEEKIVSGTTDISLTPLRENLSSVWFDAVEMNITAARNTSGDVLEFVNESPFVIVQLGEEYSTSDTITVSIEYSCKPQRGLHFIQPDSGDLTRRRQIWTQGEETDNRYWFPCYDFPDDKATSEVIATVRDEYTLLSNGSLIEEEHNIADGTRTFHWRQEKPHSSYLIMIAAGEYHILRREYRDIPLTDYVYPEDVDKAPRIFRKTPEIMEVLENTIQYPYPWAKYSHIFLNSFMWGGMENTSAVTLNESYIQDDRAAIDYHSDDVIAHELAHQWFGDLLTCANWDHLWLNEGFANYYEALVKREHRGLDEYQYEAALWAGAIKRVEKSSGRKPVVGPDGFTVNLYHKGAWTLRMLAKLLGEDELLKALSHYTKKHEFQAVTTNDLKVAIEESSGEDLGWFFDQWLYKAGHPHISVSTDWRTSTQTLQITLSQTHGLDSLTGLFRFPLDIECTGPSGRAVHTFWMENEEETFVIPLDEEPSMIIVDHGMNVLKTIDHPKTREELLYQLEHASLVNDRLDAMDGLEDLESDEEVFRSLRRRALGDVYWAVRSKAARILSGMDLDDVTETLMEIYDDKDSRVRTAAITGLNRFQTEDVAGFIEQSARRDSSYRVLSACIKSMTSVDPDRAFILAVSHVGMDSHRDMIRRASLNALTTLKSPGAIPDAIRCTGPEYVTYTRLSAMNVLKEVGREDERAQKRIGELLNDGNPRLRISAIKCLGEWGGEENHHLLSKRMQTEEDPDVLSEIHKVTERDTE